MRIVAGTLGGRRLVAPTGVGTRPTSDRVREALFSILGPLDGHDVLDLFAGSGALGLEALSRGARSATFVDHDPAAVRAIRQNIAMVDDANSASVVARDWRAAIRTLRADQRRFTLCFVDPPYDDLATIASQLATVLTPVLAPAATVVVEHAARSGTLDLPGFTLRHRSDRTYGGTAIVIATMDHSQ